MGPTTKRLKQKPQGRDPVSCIFGSDTVSSDILCHLCNVPAPALLLNPSQNWNWLSVLGAASPRPSVLWQHCLYLCPRVTGLGESADGDSTQLGRRPGCPRTCGASGAAGPSVLRTAATVNVLTGKVPVIWLHSHVTCSEHPPPPPPGPWGSLAFGSTWPGASEKCKQ